MKFAPKEALSNFSFWRWINLLYPQLCVSCRQTLPAFRSCFCFSCRTKLDPTGHEIPGENAFTDKFWGRLELQAGAAMYFFHKKSPIQHALHRLKYKNDPDSGLRLGRDFGKRLQQHPAFANAECIVPVPLHQEKERQRGYNQSAIFGKGLSEVLNIPQLPRILMRRTFTQTQTAKGRADRFDNVGSVFALNQPKLIEGKHILLVDDVLTTGATLEACGQLLLGVPGVRLSVATIAMAV